MHRLFVIDDSLTIRKLVSLSFPQSEWAIEFANTGGEGLQKAAEFRPDVILLDYMLPDMRGTDVCAGLAKQPVVSKIPVVVMTAKDESFRVTFQAFGNVVDFVTKPFQPQDLLKRVEAATKAHPKRAASISVPPKKAEIALSLHHKEQGAKAMFQRLRGRLAKIPEWIAGMAGAEPGMYFAKKLLTPQLMEELLNDFAPIYREILGTAQKKPDPHEHAALTGSIHVFGVQRILAFLQDARQSGSLLVDRDGQHATIFLKKGEVVFATTSDPSYCLETAGEDLAEVPSAALKDAEGDQRKTQKPLTVTLAESGHLPTHRLAHLLQAERRKIFHALLEWQGGRFTWLIDASPPLYVDAYAKAASLSQLALERMRVSMQPGASATPGPSTVFERAPGFSERVRALELSTDERRFLSLVDGRRRLQRISEVTGISVSALQDTAQRLVQLNLIRPFGGDSASKPRSALILEPDVDGFVRPLTKYLRSRPQPVELIAIEPGRDIVMETGRARPEVVIINATRDPQSARRIAGQLRAAMAAATPSLVAVLDSENAASHKELSGAGFHAVLVKPVAYTDLDRILNQPN